VHQHDDRILAPAPAPAEQPPGRHRDGERRGFLQRGQFGVAEAMTRRREEEAARTVAGALRCHGRQNPEGEPVPHQR
jgi:hypothetical protein